MRELLDDVMALARAAGPVLRELWPFLLFRGLISTAIGTAFLGAVAVGCCLVHVVSLIWDRGGELVALAVITALGVAGIRVLRWMLWRLSLGQAALAADRVFLTRSAQGPTQLHGAWRWTGERFETALQAASVRGLMKGSIRQFHTRLAHPGLASAAAGPLVPYLDRVMVAAAAGLLAENALLRTPHDPEDNGWVTGANAVVEHARLGSGLVPAAVGLTALDAAVTASALLIGELFVGLPLKVSLPDPLEILAPLTVLIAVGILRAVTWRPLAAIALMKAVPQARVYELPAGFATELENFSDSYRELRFEGSYVPPEGTSPYSGFRMARPAGLRDRD